MICSSGNYFLIKIKCLTFLFFLWEIETIWAPHCRMTPITHSESWFAIWKMLQRKEKSWVSVNLTITFNRMTLGLSWQIAPSRPWGLWMERRRRMQKREGDERGRPCFGQSVWLLSQEALSEEWDGSGLLETNTYQHMHTQLHLPKNAHISKKKTVYVFNKASCCME